MPLIIADMVAKLADERSIRIIPMVFYKKMN
jgi:hypothetical protein